MAVLERSNETKEMRAALTHWLQYPCVLPPMFTENHLYRALVELFLGYKLHEGTLQ
mgnify:FL=1